MSEKKILDFADLTRLINDSWNAELDVLFRALPKPTLADACGTRTLDSMTDEEINEMLAMLFSAGVHEKFIDFRDQDGQQAYAITVSDQDYHTWYITIGMGYFSAVCADDSIGGSIHSAKLIKWFVERGFNVWEGK